MVYHLTAMRSARAGCVFLYDLLYNTLVPTASDWMYFTFVSAHSEEVWWWTEYGLVVRVEGVGGLSNAGWFALTGRDKGHTPFAGRGCRRTSCDPSGRLQPSARARRAVQRP